MITRTKIICTIGPAVNSVEKISELIKAGMNVARLNFSHGTHEEHLEVINNLKLARKQLNVSLAIMLDTKGPEVRLGKIAEKEIYLPAGHRWLLTKEKVLGNFEQVSVTPSFTLDKLTTGMTVLFDNGYISSKVVGIVPEGVIVEITNGGGIQSSKGVNVPNQNLNLPMITEQDISDIQFGCRNDIDIIAASFVRSAEHIVMIKELLVKQGKPDVMVVAKIENHEGVQNFDSITQVSDGIMIARGDLGVEVPLSQVPKLQKMMIRKSCHAGKPVVTATQMLESMINNPRPTRAEASDVANAIYDSTSSVMLSGETAIGSFPIETTSMMKSIVQEAEEDFNYQAFFEGFSDLVFHDVPSAITLATVKTAYQSNAKAIFAFTVSGSTAGLLSRLRPKMPIIAVTPSEKICHQLAFYWGIIPFLSPESTDIQEAFKQVSAFALEKGYVSYGDLVLLTAGSPFGISGTTNMMIVENIGDVLVRGHKGVGAKIHGNIVLVPAPENRKPYTVQGQLIVLASCDPSYLDLIKESAGVILENHIDDIASEKYLLSVASQLSKPAIIRADAAMRILKNEQLVTLDPEKALVYKGVVL